MHAGTGLIRQDIPDQDISETLAFRNSREITDNRNIRRHQRNQRHQRHQLRQSPGTKSSPPNRCLQWHLARSPPTTSRKQKLQSLAAAAKETPRWQATPRPHSSSEED
ncbi:uncharacterized protein SPSK_03756 [Sporothrix schenckii 1099-18]|uniref:Uncharacterized protein n=1 Tax=Sporothrix schenckii 1099-18 TaxID=1397361 RepID=A0A0F2M3A9_SPOSC|nr:uncharacterized protein SPSK_03756 [Sporothrix schenckii 1099-18]KJR82626.1 hypothetical protein SPSK_03756 [Sporothrix schenckii 1099-18]